MYLCEYLHLSDGVACEVIVHNSHYVRTTSENRPPLNLSRTVVASLSLMAMLPIFRFSLVNLEDKEHPSTAPA